MAVHVVVSNYKYKRKSRINQTDERMQRRHLCNWEYMSEEENWKDRVWSYIELSTHKAMNILHLQNVHLLTE